MFNINLLKVLAFTILPIFAFCFKEKQKKIRCLQINVSMPVMGYGNEIRTFSTTNNIYYFANLKCYEFFTEYDSIVGEDTVHSERLSSYLVCKVVHDSTTFGIKVNEYNPNENNKKVNVLKELQGSAFSPFPWEQALKSFNFYKKEADQKSGVVKEIYLPKDSLFEEDSLVLFFSPKYRDFEFSFSKELDRKIEGHKLSQIRMEYRAEFSKKHKSHLPKREAIFEMSEIPIQNEMKIKKIFDQYLKRNL